MKASISPVEHLIYPVTSVLPSSDMLAVTRLLVQLELFVTEVEQDRNHQLEVVQILEEKKRWLGQVSLEPMYLSRLSIKNML